MLSFFSKYWWALAIRAMLLLVFGVIAATAPNMPLETLMLYLGFLSLALGTLFIGLGFYLFKKWSTWFSFVLIGLIDLLITWYCLVDTVVAAQYFVVIIGIWAFFMGAAIVLMGIRAKGTGRALMLANGVLSIVFSLLIFFNPLKSTAVNFMVGFYTILLSLFLIYLSYRLWRIQGKFKASAAAAEEEMQEA
jgi:uncharacterized membrane protein HdeD (DUF308 family)